MKFLKRSLHSAGYNILLSVSDSRFYFVILMLMLIFHDYMKDIADFSDAVGCKMSVWVFPLLFNQKYLRRIIYIGVLFLFCDLPVLKNNYYCLLIRAGKKSWISGQFIYIFAMSGIYYFSVFLISIIVNITHIDFSCQWNSWGKIFETLASGYNIGYKTYTSSIIVKYFSPLQASFFTFILNWLSSSLIGLFICLMNMILKGKISGIIISSLIVLLDSLAVYYPKLIWISPATWSNLECIRISRNSNLPSIEYVVIMYITVIIVLMICNCFYYLRKKTELC